MAKLLMRARIEIRDLSRKVGDSDVESVEPAKPEGWFDTRPASAHGQFLRIITVNDVYKLTHYPRVATAIKQARSSASRNDCVVKSFINGDWLSPCILSAIDGGKAMTQALDVVDLDYACLGNHEFDLGIDAIANRLRKLERCTCVNSNVNNSELDFLPRHSIFDVGARTVAVGGFVIAKPSIYSPSVRPDAEQIDDAIPKTWTAMKEAMGGKAPDLFLPMTHNFIKEDRATGEAIAKHEELSSRTPVILGGHEHEVYVDEAGRSTVVKVGHDGENIGLIDIWWTESGEMRKSISVLPSAELPPDEEVAEFTKKQEDFLASMMSCPIAVHCEPLDSTRVRFGPSGLASFLLTLLKQALVLKGVEVALLQAGSFRGYKRYEPGQLTMGDLFSELVYDCTCAVVMLPGRVIADSLTTTRIGLHDPAQVDQVRGRPMLLHADEDVTIEATAVEGGDAGEMGYEVTALNGRPIEPDRLYKVVIYNYLLTGPMDVIPPLVDYVSQSGLAVPDEETCLPAKVIIIEHCMKECWRTLTHMDEWDDDHDGQLSAEEVRVHLEEVFDKFDADGDGSIDVQELADYYQQAEETLLLKRDKSIRDLKEELEEQPGGGAGEAGIERGRAPGGRPLMKREESLLKLSNLKSVQSMSRTMSSGSMSLMKQMVKALDRNGDGKVDREELAAIVF
jgi:2',3'-cyclic-nucleotide 2'-phosphodiesterase (5'-nucleotidase family)/Ca2+-binding EF-hand superfamily protein